jgi:hypothetical protein
VHETRKTFSQLIGVCELILCLALAVSATAQGVSTSTPAPSVPVPVWQSYTYPSDGFSVTFPAEPQLEKRDVPTEAGSFQLRSYSAQLDQVAFFAVGVVDYGTATAGKDPDTMLQESKEGSLKNSNAHLVSETKITLGAYHGVAFEAESDAAHLSARMFFVGPVLYQTLVVAPIDKPYPDTIRFLNSFQLIARLPN